MTNHRPLHATTWQDRFAHDLWYVDHWSIWLDLRILWLTAWLVARREGISREGHVTMPRFGEGAHTNVGAGTPLV